MEPVNFDLFLENDKVKDIIGGNYFENDANSPELGEEDAAGNKRLLGKDDEVTVSISGRGGTIPKSVKITVINDFIYGSNYEWHWKGSDLSETGKELTIDTQNLNPLNPFNSEDRDYLTVIARVGTKPFSTIIWINVVD